MSSTFSFRQTAPDASLLLREWRSKVLEGILRGVFVFWLIALVAGIYNVVIAYGREAQLHQNPLAVAAAVISLYVAATVLIAYVTFNRDLRYGIRAGVLLFAFYGLGALGLSLSSLSGDGRVFFFAFVLLTTILFDFRYGLGALVSSLLTMFVIGWLEVSGVLIVPIERQTNATYVSAWVSGSIVFLLLNVAILISAGYLLQMLSYTLSQSQKRTEKLAQLHETNLDLSAQLDLPALLHTITQRAARLLDASAGCLYLLLPDEQTLEMVVSCNALRDYTGSRLRLGEGLSGRVAQTGQPLIVNNYQEWAGRAPIYDDASFMSMVGAPIKWQGKILGVINVSDLRPDRFSAVDIELVSLFADQSAVAIVNARLFESLSKSELAERHERELAEAQVAERRRAEEQLRELVKEKELLLKEVHHRVKNNMQVIVSMLNLQSTYIEDDKTLIAFRESQSRVRSMALVHEKLYQSDNLARVDFRDYLQHLVATLFDSYRPRRSHVRLTMDVIEVALGIDTAIPCGLLINEIVSNALKHAFPDNRPGEVRIRLKEIEGEKLELIIENDGVDFPANIDFRNANSLGLQLVSSLVNQIGGVIEMCRLQPGTRFTIRFAK